MLPDAPEGSALARVYEALDSAGCEYSGQGQDWTCPSHADNSPSLGVTQGKKGVVINCQAGCTTKDVLNAIGLKLSDLFDSKPERPSSQRGSTSSASVTRKTTYVYKNSDGTLARKVFRFDLSDGTKSFKQKVLTKRPVLWHAPELAQAIEDGKTIVIVEGEKSVLAFNELGLSKYFCTTAPMGSKWKLEYTRQLNGAKNVVVIMDNDTPGYNYARDIFHALDERGISVDLRASKTDGHHDDLVEHLAAGYKLRDLLKITPETMRLLTMDAREAKPASVEESEHVRDHAVWPSPNEPFDCARKYVRSHRSVRDVPTLARWRGEFFEWDGHSYVPISEEDLTAELYRLLDGAKFMSGAEMPKALDWKPDAAKIAKLVKAIAGYCNVRDVIEPNNFLDGRPSENIVAFKNGNLDFLTRELSTATPKFFNLAALPFDYNPNAPTPQTWLDFLGQLWKDDTQSIRLLQEWFGYVISGRTDMEKQLILVGPPRSGKSTITRIARDLIGQNNTVSKSLNNLGDGFDLQAYIGKTLSTPGDVRIDARNRTSVMEKLLAIIGNDEQTIARKYKEDWTGQLGVRFMIATNELPELRENSGAFVNRTLILETRESFLGREDTELTEKLRAELPGIMAWALEGFARLYERGAFIQPRASEHLLHDLMHLGNPVVEFVNEKCEFSDNSRIDTMDLYDEYREWCQDQGRVIIEHQTRFGQILRGNYRALTVTQYRNQNKRGRYYHGISIKDETPKHKPIIAKKS